MMILLNGEKVFNHDILTINPDDEIKEKPRLGIHYFILKQRDLSVADLSIISNIVMDD